MDTVTPRMCYIVTLVVVLLLGLATAQVPTRDHSHVRTANATGPNGETVLAVSPILGRGACNSPIFILRSGSTNCIAYGYPPAPAVPGGPRYGPYRIEERGCPAGVVGASNVRCVPDNGGECFIYNPANDRLIQWRNNAVRSTLKLSNNITAPLHEYIFAAFVNRERDGSHLFFYSKTTNKVWRAAFAKGTVTVNDRWELFQEQPYIIPNEVTDLVEGPQFSVYIVQKGLSYLPAFEYFKQGALIQANFIKTLPEIGEGELQDTRSASFEDVAIGDGDTYRFNMNIYDEACKCIQVYSYNTGELMSKIPANSTIKTMSSAKSTILAIDQYGFIKFEEEYRGTVSSSPYYCSSVSGSITADFRGGDFPVTLIAFPNNPAKIAEYAGSYTIGIVNDPASIVKEPFIPLDDDVVRTFTLTGNLLPQFRTWVNTTEFKPYSGTRSLKIIFNTVIESAVLIGPVGGYQTRALTIYNIEFIEIWVNVGKGTQTFAICIRNGCVTYKPGDLPPNTWKQIQWHLPTIRRGLLKNDDGLSLSVSFKDMSGTRVAKDPIYVDYLKYTPYTTIPANQLRLDVFDSCSLLATYNVPFTYQALKVTIGSSPISCHPNSTVSDALTKDGTLSATVINAADGPITYNWGVENGTVSNSESSTITGLKHMTNYISLYDEALNTSWSDVSTSRTYSLYATKYVYSGLYSISFTPSADNEVVAFQVYPDIAIAEYPTIEFWINGGDVGQQTLRLILFKTTMANSNVPFSASGYINTDNFIAPTAKTWFKYSFTAGITANNLRVYNMIALSAYTPVPANPPLPGNQPTVYIDDITIIGKANVLTVQDSRGCTASANFARVATPTPMKKEVKVVNAKCHNRNEGAVVVSMEGGTPPYQFEWSQGRSTNRESTLTNLGESVINVNITDAAGCRYLATSATVLQPPAIETLFVRQPPMCYGGTGQATATAKGGSGLYTYTWVSPTGRSSVILQPNPEAIFMDEASPFFTISNGDQVCLGTGSHMGFSVSASRSGYCALSLFSTFGANTTITGHIHNQTYARVEFWLLTTDEDVFDNTFVSLKDAEGTYVPVMLSGLGTDLKVNKWNRFQLPVVASATGVVFATILPNVTVFVDDFVVIPIDPSGAGFSVLPGFQSLVNLKGDVNYYLTVVDANGCSSEIMTVNISQPAAISISYDVTGPSGNGTSDAAVTVKVTGGTGAYRFLWVESGLEEQNAKGLSAGEYNLKVWDANNCEQEFTVYVSTYNGIGERKVRAYNAKLSSGLAALVSIGFLVSLFSATMLYRYWESFSMLGSFLSCMILVGCVLSFMSALVLLPKPTDALCISFIWFLGIGFVLVYGCLFIKTWALYNVWRNAVRYQKANLTPFYIIKCLCLAVGVEVIFLAIWTAIDPPTARLHNSINNTSEYQCNTKNITFWIIFLAVKGAWLIFGAVLSVLTRNLAKEINESSSIAYAIYNNVLLCAIALPLAVLLGEIPGGRLTVEVVIICIAYCFTMIVVFFKIWHNIMLPEKIAMNNQDRKRNTASSTASMKSSFDRSSRDSRSPPVSPSGNESRSDVYAL